MVWRAEDPQGRESRKIAHMAVPFVRGKGIDFGCGTEKVFPHCIGVDSGHHWGRAAADLVVAPDQDGVCTLDFRDSVLDFVFSSHTIEHVIDFRRQLVEFWRVLKPGGHLSLYLPHKQFYPNMGQPGANPDHKHDFVPDDIIAAMREVAAQTGYGWRLMENEERNRWEEYSFWLVFRKTNMAECVETPWRRDPTKRYALVIRYGALGDQIIASSGVRMLKKAGWHVTYNTTPDGREVIANDPNIDAFWIQDKDEVPKDALGGYWLSLQMEGRWDIIFNLSESIEESMLTTEKSPVDLLPDIVRRTLIGNRSYLAQTHNYLAVPHEFEPRFYPTADEARMAEAWRASIGPRPVVALPVVGSSFHKVYPWYNIVVAHLLQRTNAQIVLMSDGGRGAMLCRFIVEEIAEKLAGWEAFAPRVEVHAGDWSVREAMTAVQLVDCVCGPETGLMWAAAWSDARKVLLLSHSSKANIGGDWPRTKVIEPVDTPCFPCHRMHFMKQYGQIEVRRCTIAIRRPDNQMPVATACTTNIAPETIVNAIIGQLRLTQLVIPAAD